MAPQECSNTLFTEKKAKDPDDDDPDCASKDDFQIVFQSKNFLIAIYSFCFFASPR